MRPMAKMSGSIFDIKREQLTSKMQEIADMIDAYEVGKVLLDEGGEISQVFCEQHIMKYKVQTIIGKNYRVNLHQTEDIEFVFSKRLNNYDDVMKLKETIESLGLNSKFKYKSQGWNFDVKCNVSFGQEPESEKVVGLFMALNIE
jgi:hypothetical protein